jgi:hypothetical protein
MSADEAAERYKELCNNCLEGHNCCEPRFKKPMKINNKCTQVYLNELYIL